MFGFISTTPHDSCGKPKPCKVETWRLRTFNDRVAEWKLNVNKNNYKKTQ